MKHSPLTSEEIQLFRNRLMIIIGVFGLIMVIWVFRLWYLQLVESSYYDEIYPWLDTNGLKFEQNYI